MESQLCIYMHIASLFNPTLVIARALPTVGSFPRFSTKLERSALLQTAMSAIAYSIVCGDVAAEKHAQSQGCCCILTATSSGLGAEPHLWFCRHWSIPQLCHAYMLLFCNGHAERIETFQLKSAAADFN